MNPSAGVAFSTTLEKRFALLAFGIVFLAWFLREWFVLATVVDMPVRGDIVQYVAYAWNLLEHQTFSMARPGSAEVVPDAFRGPGFPAFLALTMALGGTEGGWYPLALQGQVLLGTATVLLTIVLARHWLGHGAALLAGLLVAFWPHHIAATGALLTEVLFGLMIVLALWLTSASSVRNSTALAIAAGLAFAAAFLVNALIALFPVIAAIVLWAGARRKQAVIVLAIPLLVVAAWQLRSSQLPPSGNDVGRISINLVQGSWPSYHAAYASRFAHEVPKRIMAEIRAEEALLHKDTKAGLRSIRERFAHDPWYHARWYLFEKPYLLWAWNIRIGAGDVYFHEVANSPLDRGALAAVKAALRAGNPLLFALAIVGALAILVRWRAHVAPAAAAPLLVVLMVLYVSSVHWVLQAEPRYSIPYRPEQVLLAIAGAWFLLDHFRTKKAHQQINDLGVARHQSGQAMTHNVTF